MTVLPGPDLPTLFALFPDVGDRPAFSIVAPEAMPEPDRQLLVHNEHMTETVEAYHGCPVNVRVLDRVRHGDSYARKILLTRTSDDRVVQFGIVRIRLDLCSEPVRQEIVSETTPLGRILIKNDVLRRIELTAYLHIPAGPALTTWFGPEATMSTHGRLGYIFCDGQPAIELLEIIAPAAIFS